MAKELTTIEIDLGDPIDVDVDGTPEVATLVAITAPSALHAGQASIIKNFCGNIVSQQIEKNKAAKAAKTGESDGEEKEKKTKKDDRFSGETLNQMIAMSVLDDPETLNKMYNLFRIMLCNDCGRISGQKFTKYLYEQLSFKDLENLFGEYVVNFLLDSLMN